jgi:hypothetical protein
MKSKGTRFVSSRSLLSVFVFLLAFAAVGFIFSTSDKAGYADKAISEYVVVQDAVAQDPAAQGSVMAPVPSESKALGVYKELEATHGVFNDGKAALWDLHELDHFKIFGPPQRARGYKPEQPIKFSHVTHVQANKMECTFCHYSVNKAAFAAVPPVETCWGCHQLVKGQTEEQQKEIKKLEEYVTKGEQIPWQKVHVFPDHAHFNHKRHVKAGVTCQECHGQVPNMEVVERTSSMKMGWCVECHRQRSTSIDCYSCHY